MIQVKIVTDGSCLKNPGGPGGWAYIIKFPEPHVFQAIGREKSTTNNRMELQAATEALAFLERNYDVTRFHCSLFTDSEYLRMGITTWIKRWQVNKWTTAEGKPVKNQDLWNQLLILIHKFPKLEWKWVKGHNGDKDNEMCDQLAKEAALGV